MKSEIQIHHDDSNDTHKKKQLTNHKQLFGLFQVNRPPSRHRSPSKATGLELLMSPRTPPKTQKEIEDSEEYSHTVNLRGINYLINNTKEGKEKSDSDYESFSSSIFCSKR